MTVIASEKFFSETMLMEKPDGPATWEGKGLVPVFWMEEQFYCSIIDQILDFMSKGPILIGLFP